MAFRSHVSRQFTRSTEDLDLAITLPRNVDVADRLVRATEALGALGYRTNPFLNGPAGSDFCGYISGGRVPAKIDLFANGVCDFETRDDGQGTGCKIHVDDEQGDNISKEGLLLCKLIADRPIDREDAAALLLTGVDDEIFIGKVDSQLECPMDGRLRVTRSLMRIELLLDASSAYTPTNAVIDERRLRVVEIAAELRAKAGRAKT